MEFVKVVEYVGFLHNQLYGKIVIIKFRRLAMPIYKLSLATLFVILSYSILSFFVLIFVAISPMASLAGILLGIGTFIVKEKIRISMLALILNVLYVFIYIKIISNFGGSPH